MTEEILNPGSPESDEELRRLITSPSILGPSRTVVVSGCAPAGVKRIQVSRDEFDRIRARLRDDEFLVKETYEDAQYGWRGRILRKACHRKVCTVSLDALRRLGLR